MGIDYSKISTADLEAMKNGDISKVSTKTLMLLREGSLESPQTSAKPTELTGEEKFAAANPNLYGLYGAGRELLRTGLETAGTTAGEALGALVPVPGSTIIGGGVGFAAGKRAAQGILGEKVDTEPSSIGMDVATGAAQAGVGKLIGMIPGVRKVLSPESLSVGTKPIGSGLLEKTAEAVAKKTLKPPPSGKIGYHNVDGEGAVKTMLNEEVRVTQGGLEKVRKLKENLTDQMDAAVAANPNAPISTDSVLGPVKEFQQWISKAHGGAKFADDVQKEIDLFKAEKGDIITLADAQEWKQRTGTLLRKNYGELATVAKEAQKQLVRGMKDRIAQEIPEIAGINARYADLKNLELVLERAVNRTGNWDWLSLSAGMAGSIVGGATGSVAKASEAVAFWRLLKSPVVQSQLALTLKRAGAGKEANVMANAIANSIYHKMGFAELPQETGGK